MCTHCLPAGLGCRVLVVKQASKWKPLTNQRSRRCRHVCPTAHTHTPSPNNVLRLPTAVYTGHPWCHALLPLLSLL